MRKREYLAAQRDVSDSSAFYRDITKGLRQAIQVIMMAAGAGLVITGHATPGVMLATTILLGKATKQFDFSLDGSYTSHIFNGAQEKVALFGPSNVIHDLYQYTSRTLTEHDFFDGAGRQIEADFYNTAGLTGFTKFSYNNDGSYWSTTYDKTGHANAQSKYSGDGLLLQNTALYDNNHCGGYFMNAQLSWGFQI